MQPTYLPWAGYFNLILNTDVFVFLDDVQYEKNSWQNRNRILINKAYHWITVPVSINRLDTKICEVKIVVDQPWRKKNMSMIRHTYLKCPYFDSIEAILSIIGDESIKLLYELNEKIIKTIATSLGLNPLFISSRELGINGQRTERLLKICNHFSCTKYLSPEGSKEYLTEDGLFEQQSSVELVFQDFIPKKYDQKDTKNFFSHLSIIDVLANLGIDGTKKYLE